MAGMRYTSKGPYHLSELFNTGHDSSLTSIETYATTFRDDIAYKGRLQGKPHEATDEAIEACLRRILDEHAFPLLPAGALVYDGDLAAPSIFIKRPYVGDFNFEAPDNSIADLMMGEIHMLEEVQQQPHPNVMRYHGCVARRGRVVGLALGRLPQEIANILRLTEDTPPLVPEATKRRWVADIAAGLKHLHRIGLAHNDVEDKNIMLDDEGKAVLIDFDCCAAFGKGLIKARLHSWEGAEQYVSHPRNDWHALEELAERMGLGRMSFDGSDYDSMQVSSVKPQDDCDEC